MGLGDEKKGIALGGFMAVGKSTVGRLLASAVGLPFVDTDLELEERFGPIAVQLGLDGEHLFRLRECEVISRYCDSRARVLATGGGAWVMDESRRRLNATYQTVVLWAPMDVLETRLKKDARRPLWGADVKTLFEARKAAYEDADYHIQTENRDPESIAQEIVDWLAL